ncbi:hypothetical protein [Methanofollis aquaemaris]|uniref:hypothetical protein n=1 Tax=Methanofollis aquaemaris TaxID=126734 RepID=UPI002240712C|nr:hypothetical protein [Methanofollis aquaemaris]
MKGKILKNIPVMLGENGQVYEQLVFIKLQDGTIIYLFDSDGSSRDEMIGTVKTVGILAFAAHVGKHSSPAKGVESKYRSPDDVVSIEKEPILFFGEIVDIDKKHHSLSIDIGVGTIGVDLCWDERDAIATYKIGDYVRVKGCRNDLIGVWDQDNQGGSGWIHIVYNHVNTPSGNQFYSAFGLDYVKQDKVRDLILNGAREGVEIEQTVFQYREPVHGRTLRLYIAENGYLVTAHPETGHIVDGALKESLKVPVHIVGARQDAEYQDVVYTQVVRVEFADGTRASVFDDEMLCNPEMVEKNGSVVLSMLVTSLEKNETEDQHAYVDPSMPALEIDGRIDEIIIPDDPKDAERWHYAVVDFGVGKILIEIDKKYFHLNLKKGDYVRVDGRVDLRSIE